MDLISAGAAVRGVAVRSDVGDPLQPARYHAVLDDLATHCRAGTQTQREARNAARELLLRSIGAAQALLTPRCDHDVCWALTWAGGRSCLPANVEPQVLIAACLHVCPAAGVARLHRGRRETAVGARWPFGFSQAAMLVARATGTELRAEAV